ncbi:FAD/NAD(P)-binding protein [Shinella pollutisoli]|uniref:FAD/NAD(P)-binding protein n=1 Tax=Shinella pollutisoli TaxID=2250594 RepID=A0ABV7DN21_9HYPH|nr:FAD/NAD(P)-binding protein [Shinella pollutisoli]
MVFIKAIGSDGVERPRLRRIAVVGAGFSGLAVTIALLRRLHCPFEIWMIDAADAPAAFAEGPAGEALTAEPARDLSLLPERPDDFAEWLRRTLLADGAVRALNGPGSLHVRLSLFRTYVMARFGEAIGARRDVGMRMLRGDVARIDPLAHGGRVVLCDGEMADFDHVFIAAGAARPCDDGQSLAADEGGRLFAGGERLSGLSVVGAAVSGFPDMVRQAYRAALEVRPRGVADARRPA